MDAVRWLRERTPLLFFLASLVLLLAGGVAWLLGAPDAAVAPWVAGTALGLALSVAWTAAAVRRRAPSVDVIAVLALAGALVVGEAFAGAVITVMLTSGRLLEAQAGGARAARPQAAGLPGAPDRAPPPGGDTVEDVPVDDVARETGWWSAPARSCRSTAGSSRRGSSTSPR